MEEEALVGRGGVLMAASDVRIVAEGSEAGGPNHEARPSFNTSLPSFNGWVRRLDGRFLILVGLACWMWDFATWVGIEGTGGASSGVFVAVVRWGEGDRRVLSDMEFVLGDLFIAARLSRLNEEVREALRRKVRFV